MTTHICPLRENASCTVDCAMALTKTEGDEWLCSLAAIAQRQGASCVFAQEVTGTRPGKPATENEDWLQACGLPRQF